MVTNVVLFVLVGSFAASTEYSALRHRRRQLCYGVSIAMALQFVLMPFLGFCVARALSLNRTYGIMLQLLTSCPGGAYSNWWCSIMNADLVLSVSATAVATVLSMGMLPLNLLIYLNASYDIDALGALRFDLLLVTIGVVVGGVLGGVAISTNLWRVRSLAARAPLVRRRFMLAGNLAGLFLIIFSAIFSTNSKPLWAHPPPFYAAVALPPIAALGLS